MNRKLFPLLVCLSFLLGQSLGAQTPDNRTLFSVKGNAVPVSEFTYIYAKTNQDKADFSEASLQEYLDLYTKFKLKVQKARDLQLDTVPALKSELEGYRRQLANSYLTDKEVTDKLAQSAYERMQSDVEMSHIFFNCDRNAKSSDTLIAYNKAMEAYKAVKGGMEFKKAAASFSEDKSAQESMGYLGYVTAMFPNGFYDMEVGVYNAKNGDVVGPFRSFSGYHVVKVGERRPARGQMEVAHILFRTPKEGDPADAKKRADDAYNQLKNGGNWDELAASISDDKTTAPKGGLLGSFGINQYQNSFEEAAFALKNDGDFSMPTETSIGWHIIKRVSRKPMADFENQRRVLAERIKRDSRSEIARKHMITRIQTEGGFTENKAALNAWAAKQVDTVFTTFRWKAEEPANATPLLNFGTAKTFTIGDLENYCERAARERMRAAGTDIPLRELIDQQYAAFVDDATMLFEESQLDKKYPDFKALMREYEEGILLFDATKRLVWDKANVDTVGLQAFYDKEVRGRYKWEERAVVDQYTIKSTDPKVIASIKKALVKKNSAYVLKKFNKKSDVVTITQEKFERNKAKKELAMDLWKKGVLGAETTDAAAGTTTFSHTVDLLAAMPKELNECRGYAVADYQDYLDKKWVEDLQKEYKIDLDKAVFNSLIRK